jgi:hypothetical protein
LKGSFKGIITKASDLKSGTKDGKDWSRKIFIIEDDTDTADLVAWGDEIKKFEVGKTYEIINPYWKRYEGKTSLTVGKYGTATVIGSDNISDTPEPPPAQTLLENGSQSAPKPDSPQITQSKGRTDEDKIERLEGEALDTVEKATKTILSISLAVGEVAEKLVVGVSKEFVMEATKIIYDKYFVTNFKKASELP